MAQDKRALLFFDIEWDSKLSAIDLADTIRLADAVTVRRGRELTRVLDELGLFR
jgi:hypothetical protein